VTDAGSGVDPGSISATIGSRRPETTLKRGILSIPTRGVPVGARRLAITVSDYQETRNMENVGPILPNTRTLVAAVRVR
jgi:hypothetical protein